MTTKERRVKIDRRTMAWLDAAVIDCVNRQDKCRAAVLIDELARDDIEVTFDQVVKSVRRLGFTWADAFLPASKAERNGGRKQAKAGEWSVFEELDKTTDVHWSTAGPDIQDVLAKIERLGETLATSGMAEYRALCDRIRSLDERATVIHTDVKRAVVESRNLHQQAKQEAELAKDRAAAIQADMKKMLEWMQTLASVASKVSKIENLLLSVFLHVVPQSVPSEKEPQP
jgi:hypothetical protein